MKFFLKGDVVIKVPISAEFLDDSGFRCYNTACKLAYSNQRNGDCHEICRNAPRHVDFV